MATFRKPFVNVSGSKREILESESLSPSVGNLCLLAESGNIDLKVADTTVLYTIPVSRKACADLFLIEAVDVSGVGVFPTVRFEVQDAGDLVAATQLSNLDATNKGWVVRTDGLIRIAQAAETIKMTVTTPATATTFSVKIYTFGTLL